MTNAPPHSHDETVRNRERANRRRSVWRAVREQRERLSQGSGNPAAFDYELILTYAKTRVSAGYAIPLLVLLVALTSLLWVKPIFASAWAFGVLGAHVITLLLCRRFIATPRNEVLFKIWRRRFVGAELAAGLAWAALFGIAPLLAATPAFDTFLFAAMLVVVSVTTSLASTLPTAAVFGTFPVALSLAGVYVSRGGLPDIALAIMAVCTLIFFILLSRRLQSATLNMLEYRAEKDLLIAELGTAKAISDESRRRAEEANLAKSRFLATMSHELRTPLNAILGFSEIIKKEIFGPVENASYMEYIGDIHDSGRYLLNLINEILDLSRIEAGKYELTEEPVDLLDVVANCHRLLQIKANSKNITITENFTTQLPRLWADQRAIRQITFNLLSNALKFTPTGGRIDLTVSATPEGGQSLTVSDNGPGIPEEEIPIVLSSFGQGSIAINSAEQGAGLGLTIVQALIATHDGIFEFTSKLREGTTATAVFPASRVMEALPPLTQTYRTRRTA